jgi:SAM-dependent methyltransferase
MNNTTNANRPDYNACDYDTYRPSYPQEIVTRIEQLVPALATDKQILEIGCGTGKGTTIFINKGYKVHAIEPLQQMLTVAQSKFSPQVFTAENSYFETSSYVSPKITMPKFSLIFSAQAFHWIPQELYPFQMKKS